jgi:hypothetical protein
MPPKIGVFKPQNIVFRVKKTPLSQPIFGKLHVKFPLVTGVKRVAINW